MIFKDNCRFGCPCESYDCEPDKKSVLVLNDYINESNKFALIKFEGKDILHILFQEFLI